MTTPPSSTWRTLPRRWPPQPPPGVLDGGCGTPRHGEPLHVGGRQLGKAFDRPPAVLEAAFGLGPDEPRHVPGPPHVLGHRPPPGASCRGRDRPTPASARPTAGARVAGSVCSLQRGVGL